MSTTTRTLSDGRQYTPSLEGMPPRSLAPSKLARIVTIVALTFTMLYFVLPIIWVMFSSTKSNADLVSTNGFWFGHFELGDNYTKLMGWTQGLFWRWVLNSLFYSTTAGIIGTLISVAAGYAMAKFVFPGRNVSMAMIMAGLLMPVALLTIPLYVVFHNLGLTDTVWAILIPSVPWPGLCGFFGSDRAHRGRAHRWGLRSSSLFHDCFASTGAGNGDDLPLHLRGNVE